jgi:hypothetical protein
MIDAGQRVKAALDEFQENPSAAIGPALHGISDDLHGVTGTIENSQVLDATTRAIDSLDRAIVEVDEALAGDHDVLALLAAADAARDDFSAVEQLCQNA